MYLGFSVVFLAQMCDTLKSRERALIACIECLKSTPPLFLSCDWFNIFIVVVDMDMHSVLHEFEF